MMELGTKKEDLIMVHVEMENLKTQIPDQLFRSEALLERYRNLMRTMKHRTVNGIITGILLRMDDSKKIYNSKKYVYSAVENIATK